VTDTNVFQLSQPGTFTDPLTEILRNGARALLARYRRPQRAGRRMQSSEEIGLLS
jgi:putative transposase